MSFWLNISNICKEILLQTFHLLGAPLLALAKSIYYNLEAAHQLYSLCLSARVTGKRQRDFLAERIEKIVDWE